MADMSPTGSRDMGGGGLMSKKRNWDEGGPKDFTGSIHPAKGVATKQKDAANVKQPSGHSAPPGTSCGPKTFPPPKNVQSAKAPKLAVPAAVGRLSGTHQTGKAIQAGKSKTDHGPRGSGKSGGAGVTKGR